jgi:hypothetical protein
MKKTRLPGGFFYYLLILLTSHTYTYMFDSTHTH